MQENTTTKPPLNQGQKAASDGFFEFLMGDEKEMIISGPAGVGKTFLVADMVDRVMPEYHKTCQILDMDPKYDSVMMTATTNKAAEVLHQAIGRPTQTIQSFLNLTVKEDYSTGKMDLIKSRSWNVHQGKIVFVDEGFMVDTPLRRFINEGMFNCKVVYVGDHCQLGPVMETISPIHDSGLRTHVLTQPVRNANQPALMNLCNQFRHTVETGEFFPIQLVPGIIDHLTDAQMEHELSTHFTQINPDARVLAYSNTRVIQYNDHIRTIRNLPDHFTDEEPLISNSAIRIGENRISVEEEVVIKNIQPLIHVEQISPTISFEVFKADLLVGGHTTISSVKIPVNRAHFSELLKYLGKTKNWHAYFELKNNYPDLRQRDAATVHKAQGSTYDTTFIDVGNLSTCNNPIVAARLFYVAISRARNRVVFYGELAKKYGEFVL